MSGLWEISCKIEEAGCKLSSIKAVAEILAEKICSDPESGAIWAIVEMLEFQEEKLHGLSAEVMELHKAVKEYDETKKGKKK
jgi:hypothetical protein